jgi:hypothetical protein
MPIDRTRTAIRTSEKMSVDMWCAPSPCEIRHLTHSCWKEDGRYLAKDADNMICMTTLHSCGLSIRYALFATQTRER